MNISTWLKSGLQSCYSYLYDTTTYMYIISVQHNHYQTTTLIMLDKCTTYKQCKSYWLL